MTRRSPTWEGFRIIFRRPSLGLAEIAWRWSFGAAATWLLVFAFIEYLDTLPVGKGDLLLLRTRQPVLISRALSHIFRGSTFRIAETAVLLGLTLGAAWIVVASFGRAAIVKALVAHFREGNITASENTIERNWQFRSLLALNCFRLGTTLAAATGCLAALLLGGAVSPAADPAPGSALLIFLAIIMVVWFAWSTLNWLLSLSAIFVVADGQNTFGSIMAAVDLCCVRPGSVFAVGTWFGLAHLAAFVVAASAIAFPVGFAGVLPPGVVLGGAFLMALIYLGVADFLYVGRLAAYVAITEVPEPPAVLETPPAMPFTGTHLDPRTPPSSAVDAGELILSDVPTGI